MSTLKHLRMCAIPLGAVLACTPHYHYYQHQHLAQAQPQSQAQAQASPPPSIPSIMKKSLSTFPANNPSEDRSIYYENRINNMRIFGVFDGHGGWNVSNYLQKNMTNVMLKNMHHVASYENSLSHDQADIIEASVLKSFTELEEGYIEKIRSAYELGFGEVARVGSCALLAVVQDNDLVVANSGDCIAVLGQVNPGYMESDNCHDGASTPILAHQINREHNARNSLESLLLHQIHPNETDVVKCKHSHACYVKGRLQLTRAFGDLYLKSHEFNAPAGEHRSRGRHIPPPYTPPYVNYEPDVYKMKLNPEKDKFIILATDGLWDFLKPQEAVDIVASVSDPDLAAEFLVEAALKRAAEEANVSLSELKSLPPGRQRRTKYDDTTVVVVFL